VGVLRVGLGLRGAVKGGARAGGGFSRWQGMLHWRGQGSERSWLGWKLRLFSRGSGLQQDQNRVAKAPAQRLPSLDESGTTAAPQNNATGNFRGTFRCHSHRHRQVYVIKCVASFSVDLRGLEAHLTREHAIRDTRNYQDGPSSGRRCGKTESSRRSSFEKVSITVLRAAGLRAEECASTRVRQPSAALPVQRCVPLQAIHYGQPRSPALDFHTLAAVTHLLSTASRRSIAAVCVLTPSHNRCTHRCGLSPFNQGVADRGAARMLCFRDDGA